MHNNYAYNYMHNYMHIIICIFNFPCVMMLFTQTQNYQNQSMLDETTACQSWLVF